ncbi:arginase family protein [Spirosoma arcticum]
MIFINPQWQGSGITDELKVGAETLKSYFKDYAITEIPLSTKELKTIDNIKSFEPILDQTTHFKQSVAESKPKKITTIGGDCAIEIIPISYLNKLYQGDIYIVYIDAHADINTPESSPSKDFHGMPLRVLLGDGNEKFMNLLFSTIKTEQVCYVGLRDMDEPESDYVSSHNMTRISDCKYTSLQKKANNYTNIYIHLDLDSLDVREFEFSLYPTESKGLSINDVAQLIYDLKMNKNVVGFSITECTATKIEQLESIKSILDQIEL